jgi:soluble lytic murein transglycosylase
MRMRFLRDRDGLAAGAADARWLAAHAIDGKNAEAAAELLAKLTPPRRPEPADLLSRARDLAGAGKTDEAIRLVDRAANAKSPPPAIDLCRARAEAYYKARTRYPEAALQYRSCSAMGGAHAAEDAFLSARAFSRADRDGDALPAFAAVVQRYAKTPWADHAAFHIARTHALAGRWREAARAFDDYAKRFPGGLERREAERYRALSHLMAEDHKVARKLLEDLAGGTDDPVTRARWTNLAALAALHDGDRTTAVARWTEVARARPLTWPALVARARLAGASAPLPPTIDPAEAGDPPQPMKIELPAPADLLHRIGLDAEAEEMLRERESVIVAKAAGRGTEALCATYAMLDRGKRRYRVALNVPSRLLATAPSPKNRWAWECVFPRPHGRWVRAAETKAKLPLDLVWAVMRQESAFDPEVVSPARAVGLMQLLPETARAVSRKERVPFEDARLTSPEANVKLGAAYLGELLERLGGDVPLAVAAYNAGPEAIERWSARARKSGMKESLDVFVEAIPFVETRGYVVRVLGNLARYGYLERGEGGVPHITLDLK